MSKTPTYDREPTVGESKTSTNRDVERFDRAALKTILISGHQKAKQYQEIQHKVAIC